MVIKPSFDVKNDLSVFAFSDGEVTAIKICKELGIELSKLEERHFEDGEHKCRSLQSVRNQDVYVIQSLFSDEKLSVNDKLCRLLFFIGALKDAAARQVTVIIPYLCYARKDRKTKSRDPVTTRYMAMLLEAVGINRVVVVDVHNLAAYQNAFRCSSEHLEAKNLFIDYFVNEFGDEDLIVVSPDIGGVKRAEIFREALMRRIGRPVVSAFMEKKRSAGVVSGEAVVGDVKNKTAIIIDDLISTGGTIVRTANVCKAKGCNKVYAAATHGVFTGGSDQLFTCKSLEKIVITNTIPCSRLKNEIDNNKLISVDISPLLSEAIKRIYSGNSIVELLES